MNITKPRVVKDFEKLDKVIQQKVKLTFPYGFTEDLEYYHDKEGNRVSALPFETDDRYYLIRMTVSQALKIVAEDTDYDDDGELKEEIKSDYSEKFAAAEMEDGTSEDDEERDPYADRDGDDAGEEDEED